MDKNCKSLYVHIQFAGSASTVEQVHVQHQDTEGSLVHYFSMLTGPFLACIAAGFFFLIPSSNVFEHPEKWYELHILNNLTSNSLMSWVTLVLAKSFANFPIGKQLQTFFVLLIICYAAYVVEISTYYYIWVTTLELTHPMPFGYYAIGSNCFACMTIGLWFR